MIPERFRTVGLALIVLFLGIGPGNICAAITAGGEFQDESDVKLVLQRYCTDVHSNNEEVKKILEDNKSRQERIENSLTSVVEMVQELRNRQCVINRSFTVSDEGAVEEIDGSSNATERECSIFNESPQLPKTFTLLSPTISSLYMLEDAAFHRPTYASSRYNSANPSSLANDGEDGTYFLSKNEKDAWWMVDLQSKRIIYHLEILPRQDSHHSRFKNIEIRLGNTLQSDGNFSSHTLIYMYKGPYTLHQGTLFYNFCDGITGRYLSIKFEPGITQYLSLNTVKVMALRN